MSAPVGTRAARSRGQTAPAPRAGRRLAGSLLLAGVAAAGCSSEQIYNAAQGWRRNECYKIGDAQQRERCLREEADRPYDAYRKALPPPQ